MKPVKLALLLILSICTSRTINAQSGWYWQNPLPAGINFTKVDFINENTGFVSGSYILKTTDRGNNWFTIRSGSSATLDFVDIYTGYSMGYSNIEKTTNGGLNWSEVYYEPYLFNPYIYFLNSSSGFATGWINNSNLLKTTDGGSTWFHPNVGGYDDRLRSIFFINDYTGFIASGYGVALKTTDQGFNWNVQTISYDYNFNSIYFTDVNTGYIVGATNYFAGTAYARIFKTTDSGSSWVQVVPPLAYGSFYDVKFINANTGIVVGDTGRIVKTTNAGVNWNISQYSTNGFLRSMQFLDSSTGIIVGNQGNILKTSNQGSQFNRINYSNDDSLKALFFIDSLIGYAAGNNGLIMKDSIGFWFKVYSKYGIKFKSVFFSDYLTGYCAANDGTIYKTINGGVSWGTYQLNISSQLNSIRFLNTNTGFVTGDSGRIFKTTNAGQTWNSLTSGSNLNLNKIALIDSNVAMVVGDNGVFLKTTDSGLSWTVYSVGVMRKLNSIFSISNDIQYIVGDSSTLLKSTNAGLNWQSIILPTITYDINDLIFVNSATGYIIGDQGRILKTTNSGINWGFQISGVNNNLHGINFVSPNIGYVVGDNGVIRKTTNGGGTIYVGITKNTEIPVNFSLHQNFPNPFNPVTFINFNIPKQSSVKLIVYDLLGREVATLVNEDLKPGIYKVIFDGTNLASGVYYYKLAARQAGSTTGDFTDTKKMVLVK